MLDRLRAVFWTLFYTFSAMMGLALSYVTLSTLTKHFQIPWYIVWLMVFLGFTMYNSIHIFQVPANQMCVFTRFGKEVETIAAEPQPQSYRLRFGLLLTRIMIVEEVRVRVTNIDAITNNFVNISVSAVVLLKRTKGVPIPLDELTAMVNTQVRLVFLAMAQTWVFTPTSRFNYKASSMIPSLKQTFATKNLEIKSIDLDNIKIHHNVNLFSDAHTISSEQQQHLNNNQSFQTKEPQLHQRHVSLSGPVDAATTSKS